MHPITDMSGGTWVSQFMNTMKKPKNFTIATGVATAVLGAGGVGLLLLASPAAGYAVLGLGAVTFMAAGAGGAAWGVNTYRQSKESEEKEKKAEGFIQSPSHQYSLNNVNPEPINVNPEPIKEPNKIKSAALNFKLKQNPLPHAQDPTSYYFEGNPNTLSAMQIQRMKNVYPETWKLELEAMREEYDKNI